MKKSYKLAFVGAGNMAKSFIGGLIADGYNPDDIWASNPSDEKLKIIHQEFKINTTTDNHEAVANADVVIMAVKPNIIQKVCEDIKGSLDPKRHLIISVVAGIYTDTINEWIGEDFAVIRSMPNTAALIQASATVLFANAKASHEQKQIAEEINQAVGLALWIDNEDLMDAVTAVSGSGPAYFFLIMESLVQAAESLGIQKETARKLILQTATGAARMATESGEKLSTLRKNVTSKGGVTESAILSLEQGNIRTLITGALQDAHLKSINISRILGKHKYD